MEMTFMSYTFSVSWMFLATTLLVVSVGFFILFVRACKKQSNWASAYMLLFCILLNVSGFSFKKDKEEAIQKELLALPDEWKAAAEKLKATKDISEEEAYFFSDFIPKFEQNEHSTRLTKKQVHALKYETKSSKIWKTLDHYLTTNYLKQVLEDNAPKEEWPLIMNNNRYDRKTIASMHGEWQQIYTFFEKSNSSDEEEVYYFSFFERYGANDAIGFLTADQVKLLKNVTSSEKVESSLDEFFNKNKDKLLRKSLPPIPVPDSILKASDNG